MSTVNPLWIILRCQKLFSDKHRRDKLPTSGQHNLDKCAKNKLYGSKAVATDFTDVTSGQSYLTRPHFHSPLSV